MFDILGATEAVSKVIGKVIGDKDLKKTLLTEIKKELISAEKSNEKQRASIIKAESKSNWYVASWRPTLSYVSIMIIFFQYALFPLLGKVPTVTMPPELWTLLQISLGGYIAGRSAEKVSANIFSKDKKKK